MNLHSLRGRILVGVGDTVCHRIGAQFAGVHRIFEDFDFIGEVTVLPIIGPCLSQWIILAADNDGLIPYLQFRVGEIHDGDIAGGIDCVVVGV